MAGRTVTNVSMGFCKGEMNKREHGFFRDYIELSAVIEDAGISEYHATNFINTVKSIAHIDMSTQFQFLAIGSRLVYFVSRI
jgi:hypothetical protein